MNKILVILFSLILAAIPHIAKATQTLKPGKTLTRSLAATEQHQYVVELASGEALIAEVLQQGIDLVVQVYDPDGQQVLHRDNTGIKEIESIEFTAFNSGHYKINISPFDASASGGDYTLTVKPLLSLSQNQLRLAKVQYPQPQLFALWQASLTDKTAVDKFIKKMDNKPLFEPVEGNDSDLRVTFYHLGHANTDYIMLSGGPDFNGLVMNRLGKTRLFFISILVSKKGRYLYAFNQYNRKVAGPNAEIETIQRQRSDLMPLFMPQATTSEYLKLNKAIAATQLLDAKVVSKALNRTMDIKLYVPAGLSANPTNKLLIVLDGDAYSKPAGHGKVSGAWVPTPTILDNLANANKIAPTLAVFVSNMGQRNSLLVDEQFGRFIGEELTGWLRARYPLSSDKNDVVIVGSSRGGYAATNIALNYPDKIGNVLSLSGAYWITDKLLQVEQQDRFFANQYVYARQSGRLIDKIKQATSVSGRFYISVGLYEDGLAIVGNNRQFKDIAQLKGATVEYHQYFSGHGYFSWRHVLHQGLIALLAG